MSLHTESAILAENKKTFSKTMAYRSSIVTLARVCSSKLSLAVCEYWSMPCHATTKFEVGVAGTTFFRPCTRVKVRVSKRRNSQSVHTNFDSERSPRPYRCMGLRHSSFLFSFSDRVWLAPVPRQCLNALDMDFCNTGTCSGLLCWWACTSGAKHNQAKFGIIWHNVGQLQKALFLA